MSYDIVLMLILWSKLNIHRARLLKTILVLKFVKSYNVAGRKFWNFRSLKTMHCEIFNMKLLRNLIKSYDNLVDL